jgi:hypothetical protein
MKGGDFDGRIDMADRDWRDDLSGSKKESGIVFAETGEAE